MLTDNPLQLELETPRVAQSTPHCLAPYVLHDGGTALECRSCPACFTVTTTTEPTTTTTTTTTTMTTVVSTVSSSLEPRTTQKVSPPSASFAPTTAPASSDVSQRAVIAAAVSTVCVAILVAVLVLGWRLRRDQRIRVELHNVIEDCVQATFERDYGHAIKSRRTHAATFRTLHVRRARLALARKVGAGESGEVWLATLGTERVAVKFRDRGTPEQQVAILVEAQVLHLLRHPHIISLVAVVSSQLPVMACTEYMAGGDLKTFLRACRPTIDRPRVVFASRDFTRMALQVASALDFLESNAVVHRDVAARNVLVNEDASVVKLADLGAARDVYTREEYIQLSAARMPVAWMAPESLTLQVFTHKSDVWSFGILLWEMASFARTPYGALGPREIAEAVGKGERLHRPAAATPEFFALTLTCWAVDPTARPSFSTLCLRLGEGGGEDREDAVTGRVRTASEGSRVLPLAAIAGAQPCIDEIAL